MAACLSESMTMLGFIGVGAMGGAMASRLLQQGAGLMVFDKNPEALTRLESQGATIAKSARDLADQTETIFASLPNARVSREVALGDDGIIHGAKIKTYIETSTLGGDTVAEIANALGAKGITMLDAPISGAVMGAQAGTLSIMIAGPKPAYDSLNAILPLFTKKSFYLGEKHGAAQTCKLANNAIACIGMLAACEAIAAGLKAGVDEQTLLEVINTSSGANLFTREMFPAFIASRKFTGAGPIENGGKDIALFAEEAANIGATSKLASVAAELWGEAAASGAAGRDASQLFLYFCERAGLPDFRS
jgi:2-hydroxy-3-oxopropionate reductase